MLKSHITKHHIPNNSQYICCKDLFEQKSIEFYHVIENRDHISHIVSHDSIYHITLNEIDTCIKARNDGPSFLALI